MFEPRAFASKSGAQDELMAALQRRDLRAFEGLLQHPGVDPDFWYGKPYWSTCMQLALKMDDGEPFVVALVRVGAGQTDKASQKETKAVEQRLDKVVKELLDTRREMNETTEGLTKEIGSLRRRVSQLETDQKRTNDIMGQLPSWGPARSPPRQPRQIPPPSAATPTTSRLRTPSPSQPRPNALKRA